MEQWRTVMLAKFGKKAKHRWSSASVDFQLVDLGIKPVCLFDHWSVTAEDMQDFTLSLHQQGLTKSKVNVVSIGQDVVIYSLTHGGLLLANSVDCRRYVDISCSLLSPAVANIEELSDTTDVFSNLCRIICDICDSQDSRRVYDVHITDSLNGPCLFGLLLGYPCVYWFDLSKGDNHCLSGQPLRLFQVKGQKRTHAIGEKPGMSENHSGQLQGSENWNDDAVGLKRSTTKSYPSDKTHVISSFTVPVNILGKVEDHVHSWFVKWRDSVHWSCVFCEVWLDEETVSPQSVCL